MLIILTNTSTVCNYIHTLNLPRTSSGSFTFVIYAVTST